MASEAGTAWPYTASWPLRERIAYWGLTGLPDAEEPALDAPSIISCNSKCKVQGTHITASYRGPRLRVEYDPHTQLVRVLYPVALPVSRHAGEKYLS